MKNLLITLLVVMASCGEKQERKEGPMKPERALTEEMELSGSYVLAQLKSEEITSEDISLKIDEDRKEVMGNAGCNRFSAFYERDGNDINFQEPASTKMYCEGKMEREKEVINLFSEITGVQKDGEYIVFSSENGDPVFRAKKTKNRE
ncbi:MAG TPA: META domain-containing protein [Gillisia sp.]|nr:META domain-containing protein [Gillisia sp.]